MLGMAYDEDLANRIRELLADEPGLTEKKMFGGLAFLIGGHMAVARERPGRADGAGRPGPDRALLAEPHGATMEMRGREMDGWLRVRRRSREDDGRQLEPWVATRRRLRPLAAPQVMSAGDAVTSRDSLEHFEREREAAYRDMPPVNVLVAGPTGVGKSTLVNAILRTPVAKTGKGRPVTEDIQAWSVPGVPITVYDTPGLELDERSGKAARRCCPLRPRTSSPSRRPTTCTCSGTACTRRATGSRTRRPTSSRRSPGCSRRSSSSRRSSGPRTPTPPSSRPWSARSSTSIGRTSRPPRRSPTLALTRRVGAHEFPPFGLRDLVDETYRLLPEAVKRAFSNAQGIDLDLKRREGHKVVVQHTTMAAGIGAAPIPIPDAGPLLAIQGTMLARITAAMGVEFDESTRAFLIRGVLGSGTIVQIGRQASSMLLKLVPGVGPAINATVAGAITAALGEAYVTLCVEYLRRPARGPCDAVGGDARGADVGVQAPLQAQGLTGPRL